MQKSVNQCWHGLFFALLDFPVDLKLNNLTNHQFNELTWTMLDFANCEIFLQTWKSKGHNSTLNIQLKLNSKLSQLLNNFIAIQRTLLSCWKRGSGACAGELGMPAKAEP